MSDVDPWDELDERVERHEEESGIFLRLKNDGDKFVGAFCGAPAAREVVWTGVGYELYDADDPAHRGKRPTLKVMVNVFVPDLDSMKVFENTTKWFKDVKKVRNKYGFDKFLFEVERHGESGDTNTTYTVLPDEPIDGQLRARIAEAQENELHDLRAIARGDVEGNDDGPPAANANRRSPAANTNEQRSARRVEEDLPIDPVVATELGERLRALPRPDWDVFMRTFGGRKIRDLRASDERAADELIASLERGRQTPRALDDDLPF